ncbi:MAG: glycosyltransferase family 2 protein [Chitinophagaceae bacterium]|nr:glycosyltransferase family 2 protein [Chitinophagaceae bacterium]MCA6452287.1 glycosyltransferase family 2 protein [Chitinophagaceae bacterium]MCA6457695.1 glycosyltransferase family 2 protein [Chitinophagaceae bacterium]MCA6463408.1 glycosyltransferase family 2 protein [Chitinophagaceae bacterium]
MSEALKISVVICTYNRCVYIRDAMESLYNQTLGKDAYEVIIVNNNSTDHTKEVCEHFISNHGKANFYYHNESKQGASFARNTGASYARSPLLCFMDDDAIADKDYLERIVRFFDTHPDAGGLGGRIIPRYLPSEPAWMSHYVSSLVGHFHYSKDVTVFAPNKYPLESNMIIRKADFDAIGGFNEALPGVMGTLRIGGEGKDFFFRLKALGRTIYYDPAIRVQHVVEISKLTREYMYRVASGIGRGERVRTLQKGKWTFYKKILEYLLKLGASLILAIGYTLQGKPVKALPVVRFRIDALKGLMNH